MARIKFCSDFSLMYISPEIPKWSRYRAAPSVCLAFNVYKVHVSVFCVSAPGIWDIFLSCGKESMAETREFVLLQLDMCGESDICMLCYLFAL